MNGSNTDVGLREVDFKNMNWIKLALNRTKL
jgi:hypothetical protein